MKTVRRLFYREVVQSVALVTLGFVALFYFFDFVEELQSVGRHGAVGYQIPQALVYVALMVPSHLYELLPITVLIGTIFVMARLAQSSCAPADWGLGVPCRHFRRSVCFLPFSRLLWGTMRHPWRIKRPRC